MTKEDKELLLQDLCSRLPYGVKCEVYDKIGVLDEISSYGAAVNYNSGEDTTCRIEYIKPYLFPMSGMTEEQIEEAKTYFWKDVDYGKSLIDKGINCFYPCFNILEFYHKNHLDYRGLIPMGLAIDATNLNVY